MACGCRGLSRPCAALDNYRVMAYKVVIRKHVIINTPSGEEEFIVYGFTFTDYDARHLAWVKVQELGLKWGWLYRCGFSVFNLLI